VLVDAQGRTLYHLTGEGSGKFICTSSACTQVWHPLAATAAAGSTGSLGTVTRPDGTQQLTYKGQPLYTFAQDGAGEAKGEGVKDVGTWTAVVVGSAPASAPASTETSSSSSSSSSGGGYHY
jgi:predicted lipoprotein with Yx(FWY)xxD motif